MELTLQTGGNISVEILDQTLTLINEIYITCI